MGAPNPVDFPMPEGGYPAVVLVHGGGGQVYIDWVRYWNRLGFVAIAFDTYGNQLDSELRKVVNPEGGPSENHTGSILDSIDSEKDSWVYHVVTNVILCNNILRNRADVNKDKVVATGISWGSVALCITSGVDKRFSAFAPVYGGSYVYDDSFFVKNYPQETAYGGLNKDGWIAKYDASSYLPYSTKPMFFVSGIDDNAFNVENRVKLHSLPKGKVFYSQRSDLGHGHVWRQTEEIYHFFKHVLYKENFSIINGLIKDGNVVTLDYKTKLFDNVSVIYTDDIAEDSHEWVFQTEKVEEKDGKFSFTLPENVTAYAFEVEHLDGDYKLSTPIYLIK
jgi:dienelactone hydrolase